MDLFIVANHRGINMNILLSTVLCILKEVSGVNKLPRYSWHNIIVADETFSMAQHHWACSQDFIAPSRAAYILYNPIYYSSFDFLFHYSYTTPTYTLNQYDKQLRTRESCSSVPSAHSAAFVASMPDKNTQMNSINISSIHINIIDINIRNINNITNIKNIIVKRRAQEVTRKHGWKTGCTAAKAKEHGHGANATQRIDASWEVLMQCTQQGTEVQPV